MMNFNQGCKQVGYQDPFS